MSFGDAVCEDWRPVLPLKSPGQHTRWRHGRLRCREWADWVEMHVLYILANFESVLHGMIFLLLLPAPSESKGSSCSTPPKRLPSTAVCSVWLPLFEEEEWGWAALATRREVALPGFRPTIKNAVKFPLFSRLPRLVVDASFSLHFPRLSRSLTSSLTFTNLCRLWYPTLKTIMCPFSSSHPSR